MFDANHVNGNFYVDQNIFRSMLNSSSSFRIKSIDVIFPFLSPWSGNEISNKHARKTVALILFRGRKIDNRLDFSITCARFPPLSSKCFLSCF